MMTIEITKAMEMTEVGIATNQISLQLTLYLNHFIVMKCSNLTFNFKTKRYNQYYKWMIIFLPLMVIFQMSLCLSEGKDNNMRQFNLNFTHHQSILEMENILI